MHNYWAYTACKTLYKYELRREVVSKKTPHCAKHTLSWFCFPSLREFLSAPCSVNKNRIPSEKHIQIHRKGGLICIRNMSMLRPTCISVYREIGMIFYRAHSLCFSIPTCRSLKSRSLPPKLIPEWRFPGSCNSGGNLLPKLPTPSLSALCTALP